MKIIAQTNNGVIVEMSNDELARAAGYRSDYGIKDILGASWRDIGKEYRTDERYDQVNGLAMLPKQIKALSNALKEAQNGVDKATAFIEKSDISKIKVVG